MSRYQLPDLGDIAVVDGAFNEQTYLYLLQLQKENAALRSDVAILQQQVMDLMTLSGEYIVTYPNYADLAAISAAVPDPEPFTIYGIVTQQGLAMHNGVEWIRAGDDSSPIY